VYGRLWPPSPASARGQGREEGPGAGQKAGLRATGRGSAAPRSENGMLKRKGNPIPQVRLDVI